MADAGGPIPSEFQAVNVYDTGGISPMESGIGSVRVGRNMLVAKCRKSGEEPKWYYCPAPSSMTNASFADGDNDASIVSVNLLSNGGLMVGSNAGLQSDLSWKNIRGFEEGVSGPTASVFVYGGNRASGWRATGMYGVTGYLWHIKRAGSGYSYGEKVEVSKEQGWYPLAPGHKLPVGAGGDQLPDDAPVQQPWDDHPDNPDKGGGPDGGGGANTQPGNGGGSKVGPETPGDLKPKDQLPYPAKGTDAGDVASDANNTGVLTVAFLKLLTGLLGATFGALPTLPDPMPRIGEGGLEIPAFGTIVIPAGKPIWFPVYYVLMLFNDFLPMSELIGFVTLGISLFTALMAYRAVKMLVNVVRGSGA